MQIEVISVIGGGWSFAEVDHRKVPGLVIAANDAGLRLERPVEAIVSMDRLWTENRFAQLSALKVPFHVRKGALQNIPPEDRTQRWIQRFDNSNAPIEEYGPNAFSEDCLTLNGNNSGVCALNLAYISRPRQVLMFGFDMCKHPNGNPYWYPPYEWTGQQGGTKPAKYEQWAREFNNIAILFRSIKCEVLNVSRHSKIKSFTRVTPHDIGVEK